MPCESRVANAAERRDEIMHYCDTLGGSSGSPVFSDNDMALIGLHFAGIEKKVNFAKRMTVILQSSRVLNGLAGAAGGSFGSRPGSAPSQPAPARPAPSSGGGWQVIN